MKLKISFIMLISFTITLGQEFEIKEYAYFLPKETSFNKSSNLMGLSAAKIPEEIIESEEVFRAPLFFYRFKYGLPANLQAEAGIESNIITYHFSLGSKWNYEINKLGLSIGAEIAYWFGRLKQSGFNTKMTGWNFYPNLSAGYSFGKFSISLKGELLYLFGNTIKNEDIQISKDLKRFNGYSFAIYVEQPLWKDNVIVIGFRSLIIELYYPVWAAFHAFEKRHYISEAVVGLVL